MAAETLLLRVCPPGGYFAKYGGINEMPDESPANMRFPGSYWQISDSIELMARFQNETGLRVVSERKAGRLTMHGCPAYCWNLL
jgi:hypothetical protein